jgi:hypothetical protein
MAGGSEKSLKAAIRAQTLVVEALDLLDAHGGPAQATVHLELALQELRIANKQR